jgi:hypothetical protein
MVENVQRVDRAWVMGKKLLNSITSFLRKMVEIEILKI